MQYLDDLGSEKAGKEYKIFTFTIGMGSTSDGYKILEEGIWHLESCVLPTLESYFRKYFPRYCSAFSHPESKIENGTFYIGVDDSGYVHGIPSKQPITRELVYSYILSNLSLLRGVNGTDCVKQYIDLIQIEVIELSKDFVKKKEMEEQINYNTIILQKIKQEKKEIKKKKQEYLKKKRNIEKFRSSILQSVHSILNDKNSKRQIIDLIKKTGTSTRKLHPEYKNIYGWCDVPDYWSMITEIKTKTYEPITFECAERIRNDKTSPLYWALVWRDIKTKPSTLLKMKPFRHKYNYNHYALLLASQVQNMIPCWIHKNPSLNLYVIKITFSGNIHPELYLEYKDTNELWTKCYRTVFNNEPMCISIK